MMFEVGKTYKTRGGWNAKILSDEGSEEPLIVKHFPLTDEGWVGFHYEDGKYYLNQENKKDLIPPEKSVYVVLDSAGDPWCSYSCKEIVLEHYGKDAAKSGFKVYRYVQREEVVD